LDVIISSTKKNEVHNSYIVNCFRCLLIHIVQVLHAVTWQCCIKSKRVSLSHRVCADSI